MNSAVQNILRSVIEKYGMEIAKSPRLCDAYLSDLMPAYPEERKLLVQAVAEGIPAQLLQNTSMRGHEIAINHLTRNSMIPEDQARQIVYVWSQALGRELQRVVQSRGRQARRQYLGGVITGLLVLGVSSAIAVYQAPSQQNAVDSSQQVLKNHVKENLILDSLEEGEGLPIMPSRTLPESDVEEQIQNILLIPSLDEIALHEQRNKVMTEFQEQFAQDSTVLEQQIDQLSGKVSKHYLTTRKNWELSERAKRETAEREAAEEYLARETERVAKLAKQQEEQRKQQAKAKREAEELERQQQAVREAKELERQQQAAREAKELERRQKEEMAARRAEELERQQQAARRAEELKRQQQKQQAIRRAQELEHQKAAVQQERQQLALAKQRAEQQRHQQEIARQRARQAAIQRQQQAAVMQKQQHHKKSSQGHQRPSQQSKTDQSRQINMAQAIMRQLIGDSVAFGQNAARISKKQSDLAVVNRLLNLTKETFYRQQQQKVQGRIYSLRQKQDVLSGRYMHRLRQLCSLPAAGMQGGIRSLALTYQAKKGMEAVAFRVLKQHASRCAQVKRLKNKNLARELVSAYGRVLNP